MRMSRQAAMMIGMVSELVGLIVAASILGNYLEKTSPQKNGLYLIVSIIGAFALWVIHLLLVMKKLEGGTDDSETKSNPKAGGPS